MSVILMELSMRIICLVGFFDGVGVSKWNDGYQPKRVRAAFVCPRVTWLRVTILAQRLSTAVRRLHYQICVAMISADTKRFRHG